MRRRDAGIFAKAVLTVAVLTSLWLLFAFLNIRFLHSRNVVLGAFHELLMLPSMLIQPVILLVSIFLMITTDQKSRVLTIASLLLSLVSIVLAMSFWV